MIAKWLGTKTEQFFLAQYVGLTAHNIRITGPSRPEPTARRGRLRFIDLLYTLDVEGIMAQLECECGELLDLSEAKLAVATDDTTEYRLECECGESYSAWLGPSDFYSSEEQGV